MTQVVGLVSLILLLAYALVLFALATAVFRRFKEGDREAARGPLIVLAFLLLFTSISFLTWAQHLFLFALSGISSLASWIVETVAAFPLSLVCLGPLAVVAVIVAVSPGARKWVNENYLALSAITLTVAIAAGIVAFLLSVGGGWSILGLVVLLGMAVGLGSQGLVFVPHLDDGPRVGESFLSALPRILRARMRRGAYRAALRLSSAPRYLIKIDVAIIAVVVLILAGGWFWYSNRAPEVKSEQAAAELSPIPTSVATVVAATPTPQLIALKVVNTDGQGILLRENPSRSSKPVVSLLEGAVVEPVGTETVEGDGIVWRQIKEKGGKAGWTSTQYLEGIYVFGTVKVSNTGGEGVLLRAKPSKNGGVIGMVREGTELQITGPDVQADGKTWRSVSDGKGTSGWMSSEYLAPVSR